MAPRIMDETISDDGSHVASALEAIHWVITIVHHPDPHGHLGERLVLRDGEPVVLGRGCDAMSPHALDGKASRRHAELSVRDDVLTLRDLGSRNGTQVNGEAVESVQLGDGDVVTIGGVLLMVQRGPRLMRRPKHASIVGVGAACARVLHRVSLAAPKDVTVLITGETGVGKELVARAIHDESGRRGRLVAVNCSAVSDGVLQSELFGHAKGAFSGATAGREGLVAAADEGTLFLDEIGDASAQLQGAMLRLLEQREYRELGTNELRHSTARFVAATNASLKEAAAAGDFRPDLLARLQRWVIEVPPLRERREDIVPLAVHFAESYSGGRVRLTRSLSAALLQHSWPANVRELQATMEQIVIEQGEADADGEVLLTVTPEVEARLAGAPAVEPPAATRKGVRRKRPDAAALEARFIALGRNASALANDLGVGRTTIYRWFREAGMDVSDLR